MKYWAVLLLIILIGTAITVGLIALAYPSCEYGLTTNAYGRLFCASPPNVI